MKQFMLTLNLCYSNTSQNIGVYCSILSQTNAAATAYV